jgi:hypothetical protein
MAESKIERYLIDLMLSYREIEKGMWLIDDDAHSLEGVVVMHAAPLVIIRVDVMPAPEKRRLELFTKLLELNANDLLHGAYALEKDEVVLIDTLEYDSMDFEDFRASLEAVGMALTQHYPILSGFRAH